jgi:peptidoglycan/xylan/chitin deacetylase (PgdA/CDA1 family)
MLKKCGYLLYFFTAVFLLILGLHLLKERGVSDHILQADAPAESGEAPVVALTFDDGPDPRYTPELLDGLKERDVKASFFLIGKMLEGNEEIVERMYQEGHLIGNHTFDHVQLNKLSDAKACEQITKTSNKIYEITGMYTAFIRPPFGEWKKNLDCNVTMIPVLWNIDSLDWTTKNTDAIVNRVLKDVGDGDIILMHDNYDTSVKAALRIVDTLQGEGYRFVTVDELLMD